MNKILFLFGSWLSIKAEMPSTIDITNNVLNGNSIMRYSDENYCFGRPMFNSKEDEYVTRIIEFLKTIKNELDFYYKNFPRYKLNYEDLFYNISQIYDSATFMNPIRKPFLYKVCAQIEPILKRRATNIQSDDLEIWKQI